MFDLILVSPSEWRTEELYQVTDTVRTVVPLANVEVKQKEMCLRFNSKDHLHKAEEVMQGTTNGDGEVVSIKVRMGKCLAKEVVKQPTSVTESIITLQREQQGLATRMTRVEKTVSTLKDESSSNNQMLRSICSSLHIEERPADKKRPLEEDVKPMQVEGPQEPDAEQQSEAISFRE